VPVDGVGPFGKPSAVLRVFQDFCRAKEFNPARRRVPERFQKFRSDENRNVVRLEAERMSGLLDRQASGRLLQEHEKSVLFVVHILEQSRLRAKTERTILRKWRYVVTATDESRESDCRRAQSPLGCSPHLDRLVKLVHRFQRSESLEEKRRIGYELVNEIVPPLHRYIYGRHSHQDVEDVLQETLADVAKTWQDFEGTVDKQFWALCYRIADCRIKDAQRGAFHTTVSLDEAEFERAVETWIADESASVRDRLDVVEALRTVACVDLPCLGFLVARYHLDLPYEVIGRAQGISADAARMAVARYRKLAGKLLTQKTKSHA